MRECSVEGCPKPVKGREWCGTHYAQKRRAGLLHTGALRRRTHEQIITDEQAAGPVPVVLTADLEHSPRLANRNTSARPCATEGCIRPAHAHGLCNPCYRRDLATRADGPRCAAEGCDRRARALGWCGRCYQRYRAWGDGNLLKKPARYPDGAVCAVEGCAERPRARGKCETHWKQDRRGGLKTGGTLAQKLERYSERMPSGCLEWTRALDKNGYGRVIIPKTPGAFYAHSGRSTGAHRAALELELGRPLRAGHYALHLCDNPACIEPTHLREGTAEENMADQIARGRRPTRTYPVQANTPGVRRRRLIAAKQLTLFELGA